MPLRGCLWDGGSAPASGQSCARISGTDLIFYAMSASTCLKRMLKRAAFSGNRSRWSACQSWIMPLQLPPSRGQPSRPLVPDIVLTTHQIINLPWCPNNEKDFAPFGRTATSRFVSRRKGKAKLLRFYHVGAAQLTAPSGGSNPASIRTLDRSFRAIRSAPI